ncbi:MAG: DNA translocase FtsK 4TM domain-containing protein, partial [Muribaculaceae bacterium]|nr:DNA translocase FtsK 4TM domain-containing protein [Muribaculaceae bacterium]
ERRTPGVFRKIADTFKSEGMRIFIGATLLFISIFMTIAVISHFHTGAHDQSAASNLTMSEIAERPQIIENATGGFGAWLSKVLLCDALGLGSLVLIVYLWVMALGLFGVRKCTFWGTTFRFLLLAVTISVVLGLITFNWKTEIYWGGNHGHYVNKFLLDRTTWIGALMVSALLVIAVCCVYINELRQLWKKWRASVERRRLQDELRRERQRELDRLEEEELADREEQLRRQQQEAEEKAAEAATHETKSTTLSIKSIADKFTIPKDEDEPRKDTSTSQAAPPVSDKTGSTEFVINPPVEISQADNASVTDDGVMFVIDPVSSTVSPAVDNDVDTDRPTIPSSAKRPDPDITNVANTPTIPTTGTENETSVLDDNFSINAPTIEDAIEITNEPEHATGPYDHRAELSRYK